MTRYWQRSTSHQGAVALTSTAVAVRGTRFTSSCSIFRNHVAGGLLERLCTEKSHIEKCEAPSKHATLPPLGVSCLRRKGVGGKVVDVKGFDVKGLDVKGFGGKGDSGCEKRVWGVGWVSGSARES